MDDGKRVAAPGYLVQANGTLAQAKLPALQIPHRRSDLDRRADRRRRAGR